MLKTILSVAIFVILSSCSETPTSSKNLKERSVSNSTYRTPVLVSSDEIDLSLLSNAIKIDDGTVVVLNDINNEFDVSAIKNNEAIRSRAITDVNIKSTGVSRLDERIYYRAGVVRSYSKFEYDTIGVRTRRIHLNDAGTDGTWFTSDDVIHNYSNFDKQKNQIQTHVIKFTSSGPDAEWFTADDTIGNYWADIVDASGTTFAMASFSEPGPDGTWFTADDIIYSMSAENTLSDGSIQWIQYRSAGPDLDWTTLEDNGIGHYAKTTMNALGKKDRNVFYRGPGVDGIAYTDDDLIAFYRDFIYNALSQESQQSIKRRGPGIDAIWFTDDDPLVGCTSKELNSLNLLIKSQSTEPGVDLNCFTLDDVIHHYHDYAYDDTGHLLNSNAYLRNGADDVKIRTSNFVVN